MCDDEGYIEVSCVVGMCSVQNRRWKTVMMGITLIKGVVEVGFRVELSYL